MQIIELKNKFFDKKAIKDSLEKKICLIGVFSKMCIHCKNMKSEWEFLKKKLKKMNSNTILLEIDASQLDYIDFDVLKNSIDGYPCIMVFRKGKKVKNYTGNRTLSDMFKFFKPYIVINKQKTKKNKSSSKKFSIKKRK